MNTVLETHPPGVTLLLPTDPLSGLQASSFKSWLESVLRYSDRIVLDLSRVQFIDSAGCGVLLWAHKLLLERGGRLILCGVVSAVRALFELIRLPRVITVCPSRDAAFKLIGADLSLSRLPLTVPAAG